MDSLVRFCAVLGVSVAKVVRSTRYAMSYRLGEHLRLRPKKLISNVALRTCKHTFYYCALHCNFIW